MIYLSIFIFIAFMFMSAFIDVGGFKKEQFFKSHISRYIQRGLVIIGISLLNIKLLILFIPIWILFFDYTINILWGKNFFYLGNTSKWDIFLSKINKYILLSLRISILAEAILVFYFLNK